MRYLILLLIITSCSPQRRLDKAEQLVRTNPSTLAKACADLFPCKDSIIQGETIYTSDTIYTTEPLMLGGNYFPETVHDTIDTGCVPVYKTRTITNTITIHDTVMRRDLAKERVLLDQVATANTNVAKADERAATAHQELKGMKKKRNWWRVACLITWGIVGGGIVLRVMGKLKPI